MHEEPFSMKTFHPPNCIKGPSACCRTFFNDKKYKILLFFTFPKRSLIQRRWSLNQRYLPNRPFSCKFPTSPSTFNLGQTVFLLLRTVFERVQSPSSASRCLQNFQNLVPGVSTQSLDEQTNRRLGAKALLGFTTVFFLLNTTRLYTT